MGAMQNLCPRLLIIYWTFSSLIASALEGSSHISRGATTQLPFTSPRSNERERFGAWLATRQAALDWPLHSAASPEGSAPRWILYSPSGGTRSRGTRTPGTRLMTEAAGARSARGHSSNLSLGWTFGTAPSTSA